MAKRLIIWQPAFAINNSSYAGRMKRPAGFGWLRRPAQSDHAKRLKLFFLHKIRSVVNLAVLSAGQAGSFLALQE
jgi:hypothetical protein